MLPDTITGNPVSLCTFQNKVESSEKIPRQICKIKYESIIIMSHLIRQLCMVRSDLLGERVVNFSYGIQTLAGKKKPNNRTKESTATRALIIIITENTMKLI